MADSSLIFLTFMSISAVLLGISVNLRNASFSSLISENAKNVRLGKHDYETILEKSGQRAQYAGILFLLNVISSLGGVLYIVVGTATKNDVTAVLYWIVVASFLAGNLLLGWSLTTGYIQVPTPRSKREETEPPDDNE